MNIYKNYSSFFVLSLLCFAFCSILRAEEEIITDIILINGLAELVDLNPGGQVLQRYLSIPDYFSSGRSHKRTLRESLAKTKLFGTTSEEDQYMQTIVYKSPLECRQSLMKRQDNKDVIPNVNLDKKHISLIDSREAIENNPIACAHSNPYFKNHSIDRIILRRQRTLIDERFREVELFFRATNRTSKAIIDV